MDPRKEATQYLIDHGVVDLFKELAALLALHQPEDPNAFILNYLRKERERYFVENDFRVMFGLLDVTGKGTITRDQYLKGLRSLNAHVQISKASTLPPEATIDRLSFANMMYVIFSLSAL